MQGARPLFFLDYLATGRLEPDVAVQIVEGLARACRENGCALLGGETAEMPGFYADGEYDVAGFIVGAVERERLIDGRSIVAGDVLIGVPSSGLHTNGYSLARSIAFDVAGFEPTAHVPELGTSIGEALLVPHRSYLPLMSPLSIGVIKGMAHITGGGITDNLPRICRTAFTPSSTEARGPCRPDVPLAAVTRKRAGRGHVPNVQHGDRPDPRVRARMRSGRSSMRWLLRVEPAAVRMARSRLVEKGPLRWA